MPIPVRLGCGGFKPIEFVDSADLGLCIKPVPVLTYLIDPRVFIDISQRSSRFSSLPRSLVFPSLSQSFSHPPTHQCVFGFASSWSPSSQPEVWLQRANGESVPCVQICFRLQTRSGKARPSTPRKRNDSNTSLNPLTRIRVSKSSFPIHISLSLSILSIIPLSLFVGFLALYDTYLIDASELFVSESMGSRHSRSQEMSNVICKGRNV